MTDNRPRNILTTLRETFPMPNRANMSRAPFETLVVTMISQNTADRNTARAFENLSNRFNITPEVLAKADVSQIGECLKVAGLYRNKSKAIRETSRMILAKYGGNLTSILSLSLHEARNELLKLSGVGPKTADVVLLFCAGKATIPVDTHVNRVSKRLGLAPENGDYEEVRQALQSLYESKDYFAVHILLILLGRKYCKARLPLCKSCPVRTFCPSRHLWDQNE